MLSRTSLQVGALTLSALLAVVCPASGSATVERTAGEIRDANGLVYRYYPPYGYRFQPLLSFAQLENAVTARRGPAARRLATALLKRGVRRGKALYWHYDFPYGGPVPWTSGFVQAVAAQTLARTNRFLGGETFLRAARASFVALRSTLVMPLGGGVWVREYSFTHEPILNAQLESLLSLETYAKIVGTPASRRLAARFRIAARTLLPRFDLGCRSRYSLWSGAADAHYQAYHVDLLARLARAHPHERIWHAMYLRWRPCAD